MIRRQPRSTRTDTLFPYTTLFRSLEEAVSRGAPLPVSERVGSFRYFRGEDRWEWSDTVARIHGYAPGQVTPTTALVMSHKHPDRSEEHTSELQSLMRISYAVFCLKTQKHALAQQPKNIR